MIIEPEVLREGLLSLMAVHQVDAATLARAAGRKPDYIRDFLNGKKRSLGLLELYRIETFLGLEKGQIVNNALADDASVEAVPPNFRPPPSFFGEKDLPVYAAAEGGPGEMVISTDPLEIVVRPWFMKEVKDGFGVLITGESMEPVFSPGDIAIVNPRLAPFKGRNFIFTGGEGRGEFLATIKRLERWSGTLWTVRQHNPPEGQPQEFELERRLWPRALRVVGKYEPT